MPNTECRMRAQLSNQLFALQYMRSRVARKELGISFDRHRGEVTQIERDDGGRFQTLGGRDDQRIDEAQLERPVPAIDPVRDREIHVAAPVDRESTLRKIFEKDLLRARAQVLGDQV